LASKRWESPSNTLGAYVKRDIKTATPISHSVGRGYGLIPGGAALSMTLLAHADSYTNSIRRGLVGKPKTKAEKAIEEANLKPSNFKMGPLKEELDDIRDDLVKLTEKEISSITEEDQNSIQTQRGKNWLDQSGYVLQDVPDDSEALMLTKQFGNTSVMVTFSKEYEENEGEDEEPFAGEEGEEGAEGEEGKAETPEEVAKSEEGEGSEAWIRSGDELPDREGLPAKHSLEIDIRINDKEGKPKGQIHMYGFAGLDDRLYVNEMLTLVGTPKDLRPLPVAQTKPQEQAQSQEQAKTQPKEPEDEGSMVVFDDLSTAMQDRIYDYLDELGVDDRMAHFIKVTVARERKESDIAFLNTFKEIIKPS
jgi:hypothetical protein